MPKYILCDIEATGNQKSDRIIQLGLMIFQDAVDSEPLEVHNELNFTDVRIMTEAMEIHNITPEMLKGKKNLHDTTGYKKLCELNKENTIFIAHDAPSDIGMLQKEGFSNKMTVLNTLKCSIHLFSHLGAHRLQFLRYKLELYKEEEAEAKKLNIDLKSHDALSDVIIMKILLKIGRAHV